MPQKNKSIITGFYCKNQVSQQNYASYGKYTVTDSLDLNFPRTEIKIKRVSDKVFSYYRKNSEDQETEKIIPLKTENMELEVAPIRPLNHPARRTQYMYLSFDREIHLMQNSAVKIFAQCPIEIGLFLIGEQKSSLDFFTCAPIKSRFGLYGATDTGILCKYSKSEIVASLSESTPYHNGVLSITVENNLSTGKNIDKVVFPVTDNSVYYDQNMAILDGIAVVMKKRGKSNVADVKSESITTDWEKSPTWETTTVSNALEMGLD